MSLPEWLPLTVAVRGFPGEQGSLWLRPWNQLQSELVSLVFGRHN
jgi:hypothetical protein